MTEYIGNCNHIINWNKVIDDCDKSSAQNRPALDIKGIEEVSTPLLKAGYKTKSEGGTASWDMYYPEKNFSIEVVEQFCNFVGLKKYISAWISRVLPGDVAPWHWDIYENEKSLPPENTISRFHCHISAPEPGHVLIVENNCLYNQTQGAVYKWPSRKSYHAGSNCGLVPKYVFNIWGLK
jgi:hypothetical protein